MPVVTNRNTTQQPMSAVGRNGAQTIKFIPAPRIYLKASDSVTAAPAQLVKSNGVTPAGWTDLGTVLGAAKVVYNKKTKDVTTGIDNYLRGVYTDNKNGVIQFALEQFDDVALEQISGLTASVITAGSIVSYQLGQEEVNQVALLMVCQNKFDGKEIQFYNPNVYLNFVFEESGDAMALKCDGHLAFFTAAGQTKETMLTTTLFA